VLVFDVNEMSTPTSSPLGEAVLGMLGDIHGMQITDVATGLGQLRDKGYRLATLTNSPPAGEARHPCSAQASATSPSKSSASTPHASTSPR
jgi:hypothetical protein